MKIFNCEELRNLVKKVVVEKLIEKCVDTFAEKVNSTLHFLSYNEIIEVCAILDACTGICHIRPHEKYDNLYCFIHCIYDKDDFMAIAGQAFYINDCDCSDYTFKIIFEDEHDEVDDWHSILLVREFWEFCENFMNENEDGSEENMNNEITETKTEETFSIYDIYKIITNSEGFKKIIEGMKDIGFTDETIYKVILNSVKELN